MTVLLKSYQNIADLPVAMAGLELSMVDQTDLNVKHPTASDSQVLELKMLATVPDNN